MAVRQYKGFRFDDGLMERILQGGLCHGAGTGTDGRRYDVCVEQAVSLCLGMEMTDHPDSCIATAVSRVGRALNDEGWSSAKARAAGLREFAYAQLGTAGVINNRQFEVDLDRIVATELGLVCGPVRDFAEATAIIDSDYQGRRKDRLLCVLANMAVRAIRMQVPEQEYNKPPNQETSDAEAKAG